MVLDYPKGSEWRKWDLHVHTPSSVLNNQFPIWDVYVKDLFKKAIDKEIACIGITDYFSIEGYTKLKRDYLGKDSGKLEKIFEEELKEDEHYIKKIKAIKILPNIELRLENVISSSKENGTRKNKRLQYHLILSDSLTIEEINDNIINNIYFSSASSVGGGSDKKAITEYNLTKLGENIKIHQKEFQQYTDYRVGCTCAVVNFNSLTDFIKKNNNTLRNKVLFACVEEDISNYAWNGCAHNVRKNIFANSHLIFSSNPKTIEWGLSDETREEFSSYKGCIWGSDAHQSNELFSPDKGNFFWVKSDPTFEGLVQATIQPKERFFIGVRPEARTNFDRNKQQYISKLLIGRNENAKNSQKWFDVDIPINSGMVAIIGNKGNGKSALADIIGYICNCSTIEGASFLCKERFQREDRSFANDYFGKIIWADGTETYKENLSSKEDNSKIEFAKYLPQKQIESICSNTDDTFKDEINHFIFSNIDTSVKGETENFSELIERKNKVHYHDIRIKKTNLEAINIDILKLETKRNPSYKNKYKNDIKELVHMLKKVVADKPAQVNAPSEQESARTSKRIDDIASSIQGLIDETSKAKKRLFEVKESLAEIEAIEGKMNNLVVMTKEVNEQYNFFLSRLKESAPKNCIETKVSTDILKEIKEELKAKEKQLQNKLKTFTQCEDNNVVKHSAEIEASHNDDSFSFKILKLEAEKKKLHESSGSDEKIYTAYKEDLRLWEKKKQEIVGSENIEGTIKHCVKVIKYIKSNLDDELRLLYSERLNIMKSIYDNYGDMTRELNALVEPVRNVFQEILTKDSERVSFSVDIVASDNLCINLLDKVNKQIKGVLRGVENAQTFFEELIRSTDFNNFESVKSFCKNIILAINRDPEQSSKIVPKKLEFYNFLYGLEYIASECTLRLGGNEISALSAGERGLLLLVFYLCLNKSTMPLIIDQPEDNLDNQSIYSRLVPYIIEAKKSRQVIIVTHNPNIALACDAEQIIYSKIDKNNLEMSYTSGSIENLKIRGHVINVLEGTQPAFDLRRSKYFFDLSQYK